MSLENIGQFCKSDGLNASDILHAVEKGSRRWHFAAFFFGMFLAFSFTALALYLGWSWIQYQIKRARKRDAATFLENLDGPALKKICGNANLPAWVRYPDFERTQWINDLIDQLWPNMKAAAAGIVREQISPLLQQYKPTWIYDIGIQNFTLGDTPPRISAVQVFSTDSVFDEVVLEAECIWDGSQKFQLAIRPFPRIPTGIGVGAALSKLLAMRVGVCDLWFKGKVRIALKPLLDRMPLAGATKISLVEPPDFSFQIQLQGGDITFLPGLEIWITDFIKSVILEPYVLPEGFTIPLDSSANQAELPQGILYVKLLEGKDLPWLDWLTLPDSYVEMAVRGRNKHRSTVAKHSFTPKWDEEFMLLVHNPEQQDLTIALYDQDFIGADKQIGQVVFPIKDLPHGETKDDWYDVEPPKTTSLGNPVRMGIQGVQTVSNIARDAVHLPFSLRHRKQTKLHVQLTYHKVGEAEVKAAQQEQGTEEGHAEEEEENSDIVRMLRGGVLLVKVKKEEEETGPHTNIATNIVNVEVGGQTKGTAATYGEDDPRWDETIEFAIPGDVLEREDEQIKIRVWDCHWVNKMMQNMTWGGHYGSQEEGIVHVALQKVVQEKSLDDTFELENMEGTIDLELRWIPLINPANNIE